MSGDAHLVSTSPGRGRLGRGPGSRLPAKRSPGERWSASAGAMGPIGLGRSLRTGPSGLSRRSARAGREGVGRRGASSTSQGLRLCSPRGKMAAIGREPMTERPTGEYRVRTPWEDGSDRPRAAPSERPPATGFGEEGEAREVGWGQAPLERSWPTERGLSEDGEAREVGGGRTTERPRHARPCPPGMPATLLPSCIGTPIGTVSCGHLARPRVDAADVGARSKADADLEGST